MFLRRFAITSAWLQPTSQIGTLSKSVMCLRVPGEATEITIPSSCAPASPNNAWPNDSREPQKNSLLKRGLKKRSFHSPAGGDLLLVDPVVPLAMTTESTWA